MYKLPYNNSYKQLDKDRNMEGLAASMAGPQTQTQAQLPTVEEIVAMLLQGVRPQELLQAGIPEELIMRAVEIIKQQISGGAQQPVMPPQQAAPAGGEMGLAQSMQSGMM